MKKLILTLLLAALAMTAALPATAEEPLLGGWTVYPDEPAKIPEEVSEAFAQAVEELTGCDYEPVALLAQQVVAGLNDCLLCRTTTVTPDARQGYALVYLYCSIEGANEILRIENIEFSA